VAFNTINHNLYFITIGITVNDEKIFANVKSEIRKFVGPVASFNHVVIMPKLHKTSKTIAAGKSFQVKKKNTINFCWVQLFHSFQNMSNANTSCVHCDC
jgi:flagellar biosynthesis regulator FlbT